MKRKLTLSDFALWAALPMAQTSKIESRLQMILDKTRSRRTVARRVLVFTLIPAAAALVILAVLRPDAKAQDSAKAAAIQSVGITSIQLEGITDNNHPGSHWWSLSGKPLQSDIYNTATFDDGVELDKSDGSKNITFAFHTPINQDQADVTFDAIGNGASGVYHNLKNGSQWILTGNFPQPAKTATIRVGVASGSWATAASNFAAAQSYGRGQGHDEVSFLFSAGVPNLDGGCTVTVTMSNMKENFRFLAVDTQGQQHIISGSTIGVGPMKQITLRCSLPLSQIKEVRAETRPYHWIEFKNVALQPAQTARAAINTPFSAQDLTPWNSVIDYENWKIAKTYRLTERIQPTTSGTRPEPPVTGQLVSGPGTAANFVVKPWKPGKSNILTVQYDYTPKIADKVHPDAINLLTRDGAVASVITQQPVGPGTVSMVTDHSR